MNSNQDAWTKLKKRLGVTDDSVERYGEVDIAIPANEKEYCGLGGNAIVAIRAISARRNELPVKKAYFQTGDGKEIILQKLVLSNDVDSYSGNEITKTNFTDGKEKYFSNFFFCLLPVHLMLDDKAVLGIDFQENRNKFVIRRGPWNINVHNYEYINKQSDERIRIPEHMDIDVVSAFIVREFS